ncbi:putative glycerol-3-phosphate acyltransferase 3 [Curcuma longa]|uniref:putative glycerol-3-phosphate acyltransferase 3 n=1 Tax=Curcuma longa TaxID=136217 RepID=UPI003D9E5887
MASKAFFESFVELFSSLRCGRGNPHRGDRRQSKPPQAISHHRHAALSDLEYKTLVVDVEGALLRSSSTFPYFMLVALESGSLFRGLLLLLLHPLVHFLRREAALRVMVLLCFAGIRVAEFRAGRAVLPKHLLADVGKEAWEEVRRARRKVCVSAMPRAMVEPTAKEYLGAEVVVGRELRVFRGYYTGLMRAQADDHRSLDELLTGAGAGEELDEGNVVGFRSHNKSPPHRLFSYCKEILIVTEAEKKHWQALPREDYPKPLMFHDGRMAFQPTPLATLAMLLWLPFAILLSVFRTVVFVTLPAELSNLIGASSGMVTRVVKSPQESGVVKDDKAHGKLYVCNHRTLLDPCYISLLLNKMVVAASYSVSRVSEVISPIKTIKLTRDKERDREEMARLLRRGEDLVVCPEGTTCREPYMLRFSPLFVELAAEVFPVALTVRAGMFYGTTASGAKWLDSFYFLMNPRPEYSVEFLPKMPLSLADDDRCNVANRVQREIAAALGYQCTMLTRRDKYMLLAGNEGTVKASK